MEKNELKVVALREEVSNLADRVADLRADLTLLNGSRQQLEQENQRLTERVAELEAQINVEEQAEERTAEDT